MSKTNEAMSDLAFKLMDLGEFKLALSVAVCNVETHVIAVQSKRMARKVDKLHSRMTKHEAKIDRLATEIPKTILAHQK